MYYSYVMGIGNKIFDLDGEGFCIERDNDSNYMVSFPNDKSDMWEAFIRKHLAVGFWNEYITDDSVVFIFHLEDGFKRCVITHYHDDDVLHLCEKLCNREFESIKSMLSENSFYKDKIL